jgi:hypothetical protein
VDYLGDPAESDDADAYLFHEISPVE